MYKVGTYLIYLGESGYSCTEYMLTVKPFQAATKLGKTAALSSHEQSTTLNISQHSAYTLIVEKL